MENLIKKFWYGHITLWKSYWLVGEILNAVMILILLNIEIIIFNNKLIANSAPFINFNNFNFINKLFIIIWTIFITVGVWRSAEKYKGLFIWIVLTLIFLSYRFFNIRLMFFN